MSKEKYIYSTKTSSTVFVLYEKGAADLPKQMGKVKIEGGAGIANKNIITPLGVVTPVSEKQYELLKANKVFQRQVKAGWLTVKDKKADPEKVAAELDQRDGSAPVTTADLENEGLEVEDGNETTVKAPTKGKKKGK